MKYVIFRFLLRVVVCFGAGFSLGVLEVLSVLDSIMDELYLDGIDVRLYMRFFCLETSLYFCTKVGKKNSLII